MNGFCYFLLFSLHLFSITSVCRSQIFHFTGEVQSIVVPPSVHKMVVDVRGAAGGRPLSNYFPGYGARVVTTITVTPGDSLFIYVGGVGSQIDGGWNGGGSGARCVYPGFGGGGASDIRIGGQELSNRVVVAGGGGGATGGWQQNGKMYCVGSTGGNGGQVGSDGTPQCDLSCPGARGGGATQTSGGSAVQCKAGDYDAIYPSAGVLGKGGNGGSDHGGGGGGGYYGGGGGADVAPGGGGSSYSFGTNTTYFNGFQAESGSVSIIFIEDPNCQKSGEFIDEIATRQSGMKQLLQLAANILLLFLILGLLFAQRKKILRGFSMFINFVTRICSPIIVAEACQMDETDEENGTSELIAFTANNHRREREYLSSSLQGPVTLKKFNREELEVIRSALNEFNNEKYSAIMLETRNRNYLFEQFKNNPALSQDFLLYPESYRVSYLNDLLHRQRGTSAFDSEIIESRSHVVRADPILLPKVLAPDE